MEQQLARWIGARRRAAGRRREIAWPDSPSAPAREEAVTIAMGFDANYAPHAAAVVASVAACAPGARFRFVMLHSGVDEPVRRQLERTAVGSEFVWREVSDDDLPAFETRAHLTRATLFRLGLEKLAPADCGRVIYLDADLIVAEDIRPLWTVDLRGAVVAAVRDDTIDPTAFATRWGLSPGPDYFNAGMLLIDLERVRRDRLFSAATKFLATYDHDLPFCDQDALNWACWGRWRKLDLVWNVQRSSAIDYSLGDRDLFGGQAPRIVHYTGPEKPWAAGYHPWHWLYWEALAGTELFEAVAGGRVGVIGLLKLWVRWLRKRPRPAVRPAEPVNPLPALRPGLASP